MSDDLVKRLRTPVGVQDLPFIQEEAADRIEELEAKLDWVLVERDETFALMLDRAQTVEAKLAKAVKTVAAAKEMYETAMLTAGGSPVAWSEHVKARNAFSDTLAELTGGKDE